jgi:hypothetical protein
MIILLQKRPPIKEAAAADDDDWVKSSKKELLSTLEKFKTLKYSLFRVGPDDYVIEDGRMINSSSGTHLFMDDNGVIAGFTDSAISGRVDKFRFNGITTFNFLVGDVEYKLSITG